MAYVKSPLKWAGGKHRLLERIIPALPAGKRLVEPFVGSGAVFLNSSFASYLLCDLNADLINFFRQLAERPDDFIRASASLFTPGGNTPESYYQLRARFNALTDPAERGALFLYLNRHGFNGLVRYNSSGEFNTPFGRYNKPYFPRKELEAAAGKFASARVSLRVLDFRQTFAGLEAGDVVYCDPPYLALSPTSNFTAYTGEGFSLEDQEELSRLARVAQQNGCSVLLSNHDTKTAQELYAGAEIQSFSVQRSISCNGGKRGRVQELLAVYAAAKA